jgi:hypothetical protein
MSQPICAVFRGPAFVIVSATGEYAELIGDTNPVGKPFLEVLPQLAGTEFIAAMREVMRTGRDIQARVIPSRLRPGELAVMSLWSLDGQGLPGHLGAQLQYVRAAALPRVPSVPVASPLAA